MQRDSVAAGAAVQGRGLDVRWLLPAVFAAVVGVAMWRHELWRDELQAWLLARDSTSVRNLLHNIRYEGHPALWYLLLLPLSKLGRSPGYMQAGQLCIATATVALVAFRSPFTRLQTWLFAAGYFVLYEFGVMSRSYSLGFLLIALTCVVAGTDRRWPWCGVTLTLVALTSAFAALVAVGIGSGLLVDELYRRRLRQRAASVPAFLTGGAVFLAGLMLSYAEAAPPGDAGVYKSWKADLDPAQARAALAAIARAIVPMPKLTREFWNTSIFDGITPLAAVLGLVLLFGIAWLLRDTPGACATWVVTVVLVVGFLYSKIQYANATRHYGHIFLGLVAAFWLAPSMARVERMASSPRAATRRSTLLTGVLVVQAVAGLFVLGLDLRYPFSNGRQMATYVKSHHLQRSIIVAEHDYVSLTVAAYLDHDLYYLSGRRFGKQIVWNADRVEERESLTHALNRFAAQRRLPVLLLANHPIGRELPGVSLDLLHTNHDGLVADEHFWLYRVRQ
ncbi:MAG: hypothetical protein QOI55_2889 [Actinomycetota bacterium]|nr:hypothetical protein [Actinomycetota bacterium]